MTDSTKTDLKQVTASRRTVIDPALSEHTGSHFTIRPEPPSADPHARWCGGWGGRPPWLPDWAKHLCRHGLVSSAIHFECPTLCSPLHRVNLFEPVPRLLLATCAKENGTTIARGKVPQRTT